MKNPVNPTIQLLTINDVCAMTRLARSTIYLHQARGKFPRSIKITDHAVRWNSAEVEAHIQSRAKVSDARWVFQKQLGSAK